MVEFVESTRAAFRKIATEVALVKKNKVSRGEGWIDLRKQTGVVGDNVADDSAAIQSAFTSAASLGLKVYAYGVFRINSTVTITSSVDLAQATFNYYGSNVAVLVMGPTTTQRLDIKEISLPKIFCSTKPATGWVTGTVGLRLLNTSSCTINIAQVVGFEVGLDMTSNTTGNVYNTVIIDALDNNKINHWINPTNGGWVNNNTFIGGRFSHYSNEGLSVAGTKHIYITQGTGTVANMNVWVNVSIETGPGIVEYGIDIEAGLYNVFSNPRVEANGTAPNDRVAVRWGPNAQKNVIRDGYSLNTKLRQVYAGGSANYVDSQSLVEHQASGATTPFRRYENASTSTGPVLGVYEAGTLSATGGYNPDVDWSALLSAKAFRGKNKADTVERILLDLANGRLYFGNGSSAADRYIGNFGTSMCIAGSSLLYATHNTHDLGSATQAARDVYAARHFRLGSLYLRDNAGVFEKSTNGTVWTVVDTTGGVLPDVDFLTDYTTALGG